ncbi:MAG: ClbS/DfsB family four-helix bundle protein, partial [Synergistaceae bacterium]|nr:ClbS/DfsB family four-helix bundle protein [Synergistaceae bacterium]
KTYPQMNVELWEKHQSTLYESSIEMLKESHAKAMGIMETFTDEELFTKKYFSWTGSTTLGSYCVSATSSHYDWAMKKIKKHIKTHRVG